MTRLYLAVFGRGRIHAGRGVVFKGLPTTEIDRSATVRLGDGVMLNSMQRRYHAALHSSVRLFVEKNALIEIGANTRIHGSCLHARERISIGRNCLIAANCQILDSSGHDLSFEDVDHRNKTLGTVAPVVLEDAVWLGLNCIVLPGVTIGHGSVIGAGSVVTKSIPPMCIAGGVPAKVVRCFSESQSSSGNPALDSKKDQ